MGERRGRGNRERNRHTESVEKYGELDMDEWGTSERYGGCKVKKYTHTESEGLERIGRIERVSRCWSESVHAFLSLSATYHNYLPIHERHSSVLTITFPSLP
jgi:hypothetical protein